MKSPPTHDQVRQRLYALANHAGLAARVGPPSRLRAMVQQLDAGKRAALRAQLDAGPLGFREQLVATGAWEFFSPEEQRYVETPADQLADDQWSSAMLHVESIGILLWALEAADAIPGYDVRQPASQIEQLGSGLPPSTALRPRPEIARARDIAELWHWRARARLFATGFLPAPAGIAASAFEEAVPSAAARAAADGVIAEAVGGDFPVGGRPYASCETERVVELAGIAYGRHWALNWLCGLAPRNRWADTPTGT